jgi:hypothetical protein
VFYTGTVCDLPYSGVAKQEIIALWIYPQGFCYGFRSTTNQGDTAMYDSQYTPPATNAQAVVDRLRSACEARDLEAREPVHGPGAFVQTTAEIADALDAFERYQCVNLAELEIYAGVLRHWLREEHTVIEEHEEAGIFEPPAVVRWGRSIIENAVFLNLKNLAARSQA